MKCWIVQHWVSLYLEDRRSGWAQRHLDRCPACREYLQRQLELGKFLRSQAAGQKECAPPFLKARVMTLVSSRDAVAEAPRRHLAWSYYLTTATAIFCILFPILALKWNAANRPQPATLQSVASTWLQKGTNELSALQSMELPLEKEMRFAIDDAKTALFAVADSVLPSGVLEAAGDLRK